MSCNQAHYQRYSLLLHWLMLLLFIATYGFIEGREIFDKGTAARDAMKLGHFSFGLCIFALVWLRIALRLKFPAPIITPEPKRWQQLAAKAVHLLLYALMIGMPLAGWIILSAAGKPVVFFIWELPAITSVDIPLAKTVKHWHEEIGELGYWLIALHAGAALFHHYIVKDDTLKRMLPSGK